MATGPFPDGFRTNPVFQNATESTAANGLSPVSHMNPDSRTSSDAALLHPVRADIQAPFNEVSKEEVGIDMGPAQEGSHTQAGFSGLIKSGVNHLKGLNRTKEAAGTSAKMRRQESQAMLKGHKLAMETIIYNPNAPLKNLLAFQGTALKMVFRRADFYLLMILNVAINLAFYIGTTGQISNDTRAAPREHGWPAVNIIMIGTSGSLLSFFLVFFNSQSYKRFYDQYNHLKNVEHAIANLLFMVRTNFRDGLMKHADTTRRDVFRFLTAAHYLGLAHLPQYKEDGMVDWAYSHLKAVKMLTEGEIDLLRSRADRVAFKECLLWVLQRLWFHTLKGDIESRIYQAYERNVIEVRKSIQELYNYTAQPIPFAYFHLLNFLLVLYLAINAYAFVFFTPYWNIIGYAVFAIALLGLRELGSAMADPFGDDDSDIPVFFTVNDFFEENEKAVDDSPLFRPELD